MAGQAWDEDLVHCPGQPVGERLLREFNGKLRDECLKLEIFYSLKEAQVVIGAWKDHYNRLRPHSALGYQPPAPVTRAFQPPTQATHHAVVSLNPVQNPGQVKGPAFE